MVPFVSIAFLGAAPVGDQSSQVKSMVKCTGDAALDCIWGAARV